MPDKKIYLTLIYIFFSLTNLVGNSYADSYIGNKTMFELPNDIKKLIENGAILVTDNYDNILLKHNENKQFIPASTIKIITSYFALIKLGENFRFYTDIFYDESNRDIYIKGYGDPFLVSEEIKKIANEIKKYVKSIRNIYLDDSAFNDDLFIPGKGKTLNPYDTCNGALCANFNTVAAKFNKKKKKFESTEPQTPITKLTSNYLKKIKFKGNGRVNLHGNQDLPELYFGELINFFLTDAGINVSGKILKKQVFNKKILFRYFNSNTLIELIGKLLESSNNFMINQIFLFIGTRDFGYPATLDKSIAAFNKFIRNIINVPEMQITEASGLSRENKISCIEMNLILNLFKKFKHILIRRNEGNFKTGTLSGVYSIAGYHDSNRFGEIKIIIFLQQRNNNRNLILKKIIDFIDKQN